MRSGELAKLAGVTVRTLRHYRKIGLMAEPARLSNGYCDYSIGDLVRLLRIRNLAALGLPLNSITDVLKDLDNGESCAITDGSDTTANSGSSYLDELDAELAKQIAQLESKRELIAKMKQHKIAGDVGLEFSHMLTMLEGGGLTPQQFKTERDGIALVNHFVDDDDKAHLTKLEQQTVLPEIAEELQELGKRFYALGEDATLAEKQNLSQALGAYMEKLLEHSSNDQSQEWNQNLGLLNGFFEENLKLRSWKSYDQFRRNSTISLLAWC